MSWLRKILRRHCPDCGKRRSEGFSCPFCNRCTTRCPNMKCVRDASREAQDLAAFMRANGLDVTVLDIDLS